MCVKEWTDTQTADHCIGSKVSQDCALAANCQRQALQLQLSHLRTLLRTLRRLSSWAIFDKFQAQGCQTTERCSFYAPGCVMLYATNDFQYQKGNLQVWDRALGSPPLLVLFGEWCSSHRGCFVPFLHLMYNQSWYIVTSYVQPHCPSYTKGCISVITI